MGSRDADEAVPGERRAGARRDDLVRNPAFELHNLFIWSDSITLTRDRSDLASENRPCVQSQT